MSRSSPVIDATLHPVRKGHRSNMAAFAEQIDDGPVIVPGLEMLQSKLSGFRAPQPAPEQHAENCTVTFADQRFSIGQRSKSFACSALSQLPNRAPKCLAPLTRRMPAAKSGLSNPTSAAS